MTKIYQIVSAVMSNTDEKHIYLTDSMDCFPYYPDWIYRNTQLGRLFQ